MNTGREDAQLEVDDPLEAAQEDLHPASSLSHGSYDDEMTASDGEDEGDDGMEQVEQEAAAAVAERRQTASAVPAMARTTIDASNGIQGVHSDGKKGQPIVVGEEFAGSTTLLLATKKGAQAVGSAARAWTERYLHDKLHAIAEIVTYMLQMSGIVSMAITDVDVASESLEEMKNRIEACALEKGLEGLASGRGGKAMKDNYKELWDRAIRELGKKESSSSSPTSSGFDFAVVETVTNLAVLLSTSKIREVRKMAVMTAAQMITSLLYVAAEKHQVRDGLLAQAERLNTKKRAGGGTNQSKEAFAARADACTRTIQEILSFADSVFQSVFTNRFRDVDAEIRSTVVSSLGSWMGLYPWTFLSLTYLKYLGWALSDKDGLVRYSAVVAVRSIYEKDENALQLGDFTNRFADRMEELMEDKEDYVAVVGTELVTLLVQKNHLGSERGRNVFNLLSDPSERLRVAAADLAAGMIKKIGKDAVDASGADMSDLCAARASGSGRQAKKPKTASKNSKKPATFSTHEYEITGILSTLRSLAEARGHPNEALPERIVHFVVSSLSDKLGSLGDWNLMVDWMQREVPAQLFASSAGCSRDSGEVAMQDMCTSFLCAVKTAVTLPQTRSQQTKERKKLQMKAKQEITLLLQNELEPLINKFQSDPVMAAMLVRMVPLMLVDLYSLKRQDAGFTKLMEVIRDVMFRHASHECVLACSRALAWCASTGKANTKDIARAVFSKAEGQALNDLQSAVDMTRRLGIERVGAMTTAHIESGGAEESQELFTMKNALVHVSCILETQPVSFGDVQVDLRSILREILTLAADGVQFPPKVVFDTWRSLFLAIIADVSRVEKGNIHAEENALALSNIKDAVSDLICALQAIISTAILHGWLAVAAVSAAGLVDLFTVFCAETLPEHLQDLGYMPLDEDIDVLWNGMEAAVCDRALLSALDAGNGQPAPSAAELVERVCCSLGIRQYKQLGAKLLSYWENPNAPTESSAIFKELLKKLKALDGSCLVDVYINAMRLCYQRYCKEVYSFPEAERTTRAEKAIEPFLLLSHKIANSQAALNATSTLASVAEKAALWALEETPKNLEFLQGASYFVVKVKGGDAASILDKLVSAGLEAGAPPDSGDELGDWELFYEYCDVLKVQVQKSKGGVLKKSTPKSAGGKKQKRRISFAMADEGDFEAKIDRSDTRERRRSRRESGSHNYKETQSDDVRADDDDIVEF